MKKRLFCFALTFCLLLSFSSCTYQNTSSTPSQCEWYDLFDTYCTFTCYDDLSDEAFQDLSSGLHDFLYEFHKETDIYHDFEGTEGLYELNQRAGTAEGVTIGSQLMDFLTFAKKAYDTTQGRVNVMMGSVTSLWEKAREEKVLPDEEALREAGQHRDIGSLQLDPENGTALITDSAARIDVGALAKGWAGDMAKEYLKEKGVSHYLLNLGGNIVTHGKPLGTGRDYFSIGVQDADAEEGTYAETLSIQDKAVVTSGDYQRYVDIGGTRYHHLIDPDTLYPASYHHSVTVVCESSCMADMLSTALFVCSEEKGSSILEPLQKSEIITVYYQ